MGHDPSASRKDGGKQSPGERASRERSGRDTDGYRGLCANCAKRDTCLLPEPEGGVWHCEQYVEEL